MVNYAETHQDQKEQFTAALSALGVCDSGFKAGLMLDYMRLVLERNEVMNLTAITDEAEFVKRHLLDSVACYGRSEIKAAKSVVDVGTGAGFPGVPLAVCYPDKDFLLIDSLAKRVSFIEEACAKLGIGNVRTLHARAEDVGQIRRSGGKSNVRFSASASTKPHTDAPTQSHTGAPAPPLRESFDLAVSRAVAHLAILYEYCLPLVKPSGAFYAYKSESQIAEIAESKRARLLLGATEDAEVWRVDADSISRSQQSHPQQDRSQQHRQTHIIIITRKESPTPKAYPRKAGTPAKIPLVKNCENCYSLCCSYRGKADKPCPKENQK